MYIKPKSCCEVSHLTNCSWLFKWITWITSDKIHPEFLVKVWDSNWTQCSLVHPYSCSFIFTAWQHAAKNVRHKYCIASVLYCLPFFDSISSRSFLSAHYIYSGTETEPANPQEDQFMFHSLRGIRMVQARLSWIDFLIF